MSGKVQAYTVVIIGFTTVINAVGLVFDALRHNEQQRQIDQLSLATMAWVRSQSPVNEGTTVIEAGTVYDLYFADFSRETAVLTSRKSDSEGRKQTEYTIVHGVPSKLLEEWCKHPHDVQ